MSVLHSIKNSAQTEPHFQNVLTSFQANNDLYYIPMASSVYRSEDEEIYPNEHTQQEMIGYGKQFQTEERLAKNVRSLSRKRKFDSEGKNKSESKQKILSVSNYSINTDNIYKRKQRSKSNLQKLKILNSIAEKLSNIDRSQAVTEKVKTKQEWNSKQSEQLKHNKSTKLSYLLKDIKESNKQNSKAIYSIKKTQVKATKGKEQIKINYIENDQNQTPIHSSNYLSPSYTTKQKSKCPACGCLCKIKNSTQHHQNY